MKAQPEQKLHIAVAEYLKLVLLPQTFWTSIDHAGGGFTVGRYRKARGVKKGLPDIYILNNGWSYHIELKTEGGKLEPEQLACHQWIVMAGGKIAICRSVNDVANTLADWGIRTRDASVRKAA